MNHTSTVVNGIYQKTCSHGPSLGLTSLLFLLLCPSAHAFRVTPMEETFTPSGRDSTKSFIIENKNKEPLLVDIKVSTRGVKPDLTETNSKTTDFLVFPNRLTIAPGQKRTVRATYVGKRDIDKENSYRISFEELPAPAKFVKTSKPVATIRLAVKYVTAVYVRPSGATSKLELKSLHLSKDRKNVELKIENSGTAHGRLLLATMDLAFGDSVIAFDEHAYDQLRGTNYLPKNEFNITVPLDPKNIPSGPATRLELKSNE